MPKPITSILEAIGLITREVREMADSGAEIKRDQCVECGGILTHPGVYFCEDCAPEFYKGERENNNEEGME